MHPSFTATCQVKVISHIVSTIPNPPVVGGQGMVYIRVSQTGFREGVTGVPRNENA